MGEINEDFSRHNHSGGRCRTGSHVVGYTGDQLGESSQASYYSLWASGALSINENRKGHLSGKLWTGPVLRLPISLSKCVVKAGAIFAHTRLFVGPEPVLSHKGQSWPATAILPTPRLWWEGR